ncbi:ubiquitin carboxyl-terminal hydrolase 17 isoform X1 [Dendrobium catenatum]|uniref:ubiquitin carboxyl-terminal hydrolase 17 isoform X1 n=1 Tax=Dendrobium catenatum TaxID=906689 RepID=UPI0009F6B4C8|nr:ubiquitin carboxyl-terminal hydrolase 17 isoform X1 [Dendrobium catenatum]
MPYQWNPGWSGAVLVVFFVFFLVLALVVRRKWRLARIRRMEVMRLVRLAAAEAERAEKEAAAFIFSVEKPVSVVDGGGIGMQNCAVCHNPTTTRCSRCKAVKYCSGTCQITHWRQGHKYECHPPLIFEHYKGQPNVSDLKGVENEKPEMSGNGLGIDGNGHTAHDGFSIAQSISNTGVAQSEPSVLIDRRLDMEVKPNDTKGRANISNLMGVQDEKPEISGNGLGIEGKGHATSGGFYVDQSVSNTVEAPSEPPVLVFSRSDIEVKPNDAKRLETFSTMPVSSESNITSKVHSENGEDGEKHFMNTSKKGSIIDPLSSSLSTISGRVEMLDNASCSEGLPRGQHADANAHDRLDEVFPGSYPDRHKTSVTDSGQPNLPTFPHTTTTAGSLSYASFSSDLQPHLTHVNHETEFKLSAPSNMNSPSPDKSIDARISKNAREFSPSGLGSINNNNSKTSKFSENYCEGRGETLDLTAAAGSTESQSCHNIHLQLDSRLHFEVDVKLSSMKSCSAATNGGISDFGETVSLVIGNSGEVAKESNNEQLKSSSPNYLKDHLVSAGHSKSFQRSGSPKVENIPPVSDKSLKADGSLPNGKITSRKAAQLISPSSSLSRRSQSGLSNHGHGKYDYKMLFPYDNFIRLYNSDKVEMHPCGLVNCGNSCYANAVLQCLAFTRPLAAYMLEGFHAKACPKVGWCFTCELETLLIKVKQGKSPVSPNGIISHIHDIGGNFGHGREEDAHEFLRYSIDALQSACLKEAGASIVGELAEETTLIQLIFGGYLRSKIKCMRCQGKSEQRERMMDLTIDIHGDIGTLEEALARFTASEVLEGDNKYKCGRCQSFERAKKQLTILEAPNVLTIAFKRYQSGKYGKLNRMVRFSEYLNLAPYMRGSDDNSPVYRLYAVVVHSGQANATFSGHYVCYVKNTQGKWFKADDSVVKEVDLQKVLSQGAYLLLYARCSPRAPSLLRKEMAKKIKSKELIDVPNSTTRSSSMFFHPGNKTNHNHTGLHDLFDERFRRPPKVDSSSDISSLFSYSDEGSSWSTESTKDSATSDDFADSSFSEPGYMNSPRRVSVSSDASSLDLKVDRDGGNVGESGSEGRESPSFLYSIKHYRNLTEQLSSRSNTDWVNSSERKSNVLFRRTGGDRTAQTFY